MLIRELPLTFYTSRLRRKKYFCFPGYSDAEFYCMLGIREGGTTGLGQILSQAHGEKLLAVMKRRQRDPNWFFAIPKCLTELPALSEGQIDKLLKTNLVKIEGYERDMVLDDAARDAKLFPLIYQLQQMDSVIIGPEEFSNGGLDFLDFKEHVDIVSPNLHMTEQGVDFAVERAMGYKDVVVLVSAGVSSPIIIDKLYENNPNNFYVDCGSIWDAFVGIGGQREWRAELYKDVDKLEQWKRKNINGS